jgi:hypothetical protein
MDKLIPWDTNQLLAVYLLVNGAIILALGIAFRLAGPEEAPAAGEGKGIPGEHAVQLRRDQEGGAAPPKRSCAMVRLRGCVLSGAPKGQNKGAPGNALGVGGREET